MDEDNNLTEVVETKNIVKTADGAEVDGVAVDVYSLVSMNMWGLTPDFLDVLEDGFKEFFQKEVTGNPQKAEYLIPIFIVIYRSLNRSALYTPFANIFLKLSFTAATSSWCGSRRVFSGLHEYVGLDS